MDDADKKLERLVSAAREGGGEAGDVEPPFGFATRVVAEAFARPAQSLLRAWESLSWRFLGAACAIAVLVAVTSRPAVAEETHEADILVELTDQTFELAFIP